MRGSHACAAPPAMSAPEQASYVRGFSPPPAAVRASACSRSLFLSPSSQSFSLLLPVTFTSTRISRSSLHLRAHSASWVRRRAKIRCSASSSQLLVRPRRRPSCPPNPLLPRSACAHLASAIHLHAINLQRASSAAGHFKLSAGPTFNPASLVHGEHELILHAALVPGARLRCRSRITDVTDKARNARGRWDLDTRPAMFALHRNLDGPKLGTAMSHCLRDDSVAAVSDGL